jgi:protoporphyrin/coproporphyrin ferrochelatase
MSIHGAAHTTSPRHDDAARTYDAILIVSYGGPEGMDDVLPFLENATRGRNVPRERLMEVAKHYEHFDGVSPLNAQNRALAHALKAALITSGHDLPVYVGNRNWHPYLADTLRQMRDDGIERALAVITSAFSSYSSCRQYREDVIGALAEVGVGAPEVDKLRPYFNHPLFVEANAVNLRASISNIPVDRRTTARIVFTAHSIPNAMAARCEYESQLREAARLVAESCGVSDWSFAFQSRSGPPHVPWLGPDIVEFIENAAADGARDIVVQPIGFISDHMEVMFDLDIEAQEAAKRLGVHLQRASTVGVSPPFIEMLVELITERTTANPERRALGPLGASHDVCPADCCLRS